MTNTTNKKESNVTTVTQQPTIDTALIDIVPGFNSRDFDVDNPPTDDPQYTALAESVALAGVRVAVIVVPNGDRYILKAGHRRVAAAKAAGKPVPYSIDQDDSRTTTAVENLVRKDLNTLEEAREITALIADGGYSEQGAADLFGTTAAVIRNRLAIIALPDRIQKLFGAPVHLSTRSVDILVALHQTRQEQWLENIAKLYDDAHERDRAVTGWTLNRTAPKGTYIATLHVNDIKTLRPTKAINEQVDALIKAKRLKHDWEINNLSLEIADEWLDAAKQFGVLFEDPDSSYGPWITDPAWLKENLPAIIATEADRVRSQTRTTRTSTTKAEQEQLTPEQQTELTQKREQRAKLRDLKPEADAANLALFRHLMDKESVIKTDLSLAQAQMWVWTVLGNPKGSVYDTGGKQVIHQLAGVARLVVPALRQTVDQEPTATGRERPPKVEFADNDKAIDWIVGFLRVKTAGELLGRTMVLLAASTHAIRHAAPKRADEWFPVDFYGGPNREAGRALESLTKAMIPAHHTKLKDKIEREIRKGQTLGI